MKPNTDKGGWGRRTVTYVEQLLVYEALLLQILEESIKSSLIADKITLKLYELCLYVHKHLQLGVKSELRRLRAETSQS